MPHRSIKRVHREEKQDSRAKRDNRNCTHDKRRGGKTSKKQCWFSFRKSPIFYLFLFPFHPSLWHQWMMSVRPSNQSNPQLPCPTIQHDFGTLSFDSFHLSIWIFAPSYLSVWYSDHCIYHKTPIYILVYLGVSVTVHFACLSFLKFEMQCSSQRGANLHVGNHETGLASCKHVWKEQN